MSLSFLHYNRLILTTTNNPTLHLFKLFFVLLISVGTQKVHPTEELKGPMQVLNRSHWQKPSLLILVTAASKVTPHLTERSNHSVSLHDASRTVSYNTCTLPSLSHIILMYESPGRKTTQAPWLSLSHTREHIQSHKDQMQKTDPKLIWHWALDRYRKYTWK